MFMTHTELRLSSSTKFWKWSTLLQRETLQGRNCWTLSIMTHYNTERLSSHFCTLVFNTPNFVWSGKVLKVSSNLDQKKLMCIFPMFERWLLWNQTKWVKFFTTFSDLKKLQKGAKKWINTVVFRSYNFDTQSLEEMLRDGKKKL